MNYITHRRKPSLRWRIRNSLRHFVFEHERFFNLLARIRNKIIDAAIWLLFVGGTIGICWLFAFIVGKIVILLEWW